MAADFVIRRRGLLAPARSFIREPFLELNDRSRKLGPTHAHRPYLRQPDKHVRRYCYSAAVEGLRGLDWDPDTGATRRRIFGGVSTYADVDPALLGPVGELTDFVTARD